MLVLFLYNFKKSVLAILLSVRRFILGNSLYVKLCFRAV